VGIPDYQSIMLPLLRYAADGIEHSFRDAIDALAVEQNVTDEDREVMLPSGRAKTYNNRVGWALTYLKKAALLDTTKRGYFKITKRGLEVLKQKPTFINVAFLKQFPEFIEFQSVKSEPDVQPAAEVATSTATPEEALESAYERIRDELAVDLRKTIGQCSPAFFERLVVDLLVTMGYGGTRKDAGQAVGKSGDGGIDGIIKEDRLGLDIIYIQAKRWQNDVGRPEVQKFAGALQGQRAKKGMFITTSKFTREAREFVAHIDTKIILIDGDTLAQLLIDHNVGVAVVDAYEIKRLDSDYFVDA
jgi:restriction system protein